MSLTSDSNGGFEVENMWVHVPMSIPFAELLVIFSTPRKIGKSTFTQKVCLLNFPAIKIWIKKMWHRFAETTADEQQKIPWKCYLFISLYHSIQYYTGTFQLFRLHRFTEKPKVCGQNFEVRSIYPPRSKLKKMVTYNYKQCIIYIEKKGLKDHDTMIISSNADTLWVSPSLTPRFLPKTLPQRLETCGCRASQYVHWMLDRHFWCNVTVGVLDESGFYLAQEHSEPRTFSQISLQRERD